MYRSLGQNDIWAENVILQPLVSMVRRDLLPALKVVSVVLPTIGKDYLIQRDLLIDIEKYFLSK